MNLHAKFGNRLANRDEAKFMIVGTERDRYYELIAFARDEFTAYLIRKAVIDNGGFAKIMPYSEANLKKVEDEIESEFQKVR